MENIVFTLQFSDLLANEHANAYLAKGWTLVSAGPVCAGMLDNGQADYEMSYVVGANQQQYDEYKKEQESLKSYENDVNKMLNSDDVF
ncbi:hypothetical protein [uncultured Limosilactobacillus sp.]|uniref:hypothetical protein n=1 Tax=uncultured Limosilactobacillus sp. TaxID=2837629 RepID=UPI0025970A74|nr:hypothetical protein [uncultured Limosilactobacillus sp.]